MKAKKINYAKRHENSFREACKKVEGIIIERLWDSIGGKMNLKQPSDFIAYKMPYIYYVECKTTQEENFPLGNISDHQWKSLNERAKIEGCVAGILLEYRIDEDNIKVFFIEIAYLNKIKNRQGQKYISINEAEQIGIEVPTKKKKVNFSYDISKLF